MNNDSNARTLTGTIVSVAREKTITVKVERKKVHPKYKKYLRVSSKFHAHDEANKGKLGDLVTIRECPPISKTKTWKLVDVLKSTE
jgi:small subunit ribosomal protein S17